MRDNLPHYFQPWNLAADGILGLVWTQCSVVNTAASVTHGFAHAVFGLHGLTLPLKVGSTRKDFSLGESEDYYLTFKTADPDGDGWTPFRGGILRVLRAEPCPVAREAEVESDAAAGPGR